MTNTAIAEGKKDNEVVTKSPPKLSSVAIQPITKSTATYVPAPEAFTQKGPAGISYDFNDGCRVKVPEGNFLVEIRDTTSDYVVYRMPMTDNGVTSVKKFFVPFGVRVWQDGNLVFEHKMDLRGKKVLMQFPKGGIMGDVIAWFTYVNRFAEQHECELTCAMSDLMIPLFRDTHPKITFKTPEHIDTSEFYATYYLGLFFDDVTNRMQPIDFRHAGLHRTAAHILGVDTAEEPPLIDVGNAARPIPEKYVVIATKASTQCKYWNYPGGWMEIVRFLKEAGYRVICIDKERTHDIGLMRNHIPHGCEDQTGPRPLVERAHWLKHAEFFVGLSSGLSWLAWAVGTPVVMISGFTLPNNEFWTPYRIINHHVCTGCWNDPKQMFDHKDFMWCPRHAGTEKQFECTTHITPEQVRQVIRTIPNFGA